MRPSILLTAFLLVTVQFSPFASADFIINLRHASGSVGAAGEAVDSFSSSSIGFFSATASADDPTTSGTNIHTATVTAELGHNLSQGILFLDTYITATAASSVSTVRRTGGGVEAYFTFTTTTPYNFQLTGNDPNGNAILQEASSSQYFSVGQSGQIAPGQYLFTAPISLGTTEIGTVSCRSTANLQLSAVPEPGTGCLAAIGTTLLAFIRKRSNNG